MFIARSKIIKKDDVSLILSKKQLLTLDCIVKAYRFGRRVCQVHFTARDEQP